MRVVNEEKFAFFDSKISLFELNGGGVVHNFSVEGSGRGGVVGRGWVGMMESFVGEFINVESC